MAYFKVQLQLIIMILFDILPFVIMYYLLTKVDGWFSFYLFTFTFKTSFIDIKLHIYLVNEKNKKKNKKLCRIFFYITHKKKLTGLIKIIIWSKS